MVQIDSAPWALVRESLGEAAHRVAGLIREVPDREAPGTGSWTAADTAAHLSHTFVANLSAVWGPTRDLPRLLTAPVSTVTEVSGFNAANLGADPDRDLQALSARIEDTAVAFLEETSGASGDELVMWVGGAKLPVSALACHWIGESLLHGHDIARGSGLHWTIEPDWAALTFSGFFVPAVAALPPAAIVDQERASGVNAAVEMRIRGAGSVLLVLEDRALRVESPGSRKPDCRVSTDPVTNFLLVWGRVSRLKATAKGRLVVWGRRPWKALQLTRAMKMP